MIDFDVSELRTSVKQIAPMADFEAHYTFYYDETNNIKNLHIKENKFNADFTANFILGGIAYENEAIDVTSLFESFNLQKNIKEVKFDHIAKGSFLQCLKSKNLRLFSEFIFNSDFYIHYSSFNFLYWSIADIVDSALMSSGVNQSYIQYHRQLKNALYAIIKSKIHLVIPIFNNYKYPNIVSKDVIPFIDELLNLLNNNIIDKENVFFLDLLKRLLIEAKKSNELPFLGDEEDYILIKNFSQLYLRPIYIFKNSKHIFDNEDSMKEIINDTRLVDNGIEIHNYTFKDSQSDQLIQLSDIFVGIMGKLTQYLNTKTIQEINSDFKGLTELQKENIKLLIKLIDKSHNKNLGLLFNIDSDQEINKLNLIRRLKV